MKTFANAIAACETVLPRRAPFEFHAAKEFRGYNLPFWAVGSQDRDVSWEAGVNGLA